MSDRIVVVVQARTGSTRLPGKILLPVAGQPLLTRMLERVLAAHEPDAVVVATTTDPSDDPVRALARALDVPVYSGHPTDLLDRHWHAARQLAADVVVKIPSDCPLIDPAVIDHVLHEYRAHRGAFDFVSNLHPPTYPDGHDVEVMPLDVLELAHREATAPHHREHTTPFIWDQPERFRIGNVAWPSGRDLSMSHRFTIDYPEDYAFVSAVYGALHAVDAPTFSLEDILALLDARPDVMALNAKYAGVNWYRDHLRDLRTVTADQTRRPPAEHRGHA